MNGQAHPGAAGTDGVSGAGVGGGLDLFPAGTVTIDNTNVTGKYRLDLGQRRIGDVLGLTETRVISF